MLACLIIGSLKSLLSAVARITETIDAKNIREKSVWSRVSHPKYCSADVETSRSADRFSRESFQISEEDS
jgi:hypothetical protein